jgi:predicted DCC family thiol-disulfide oxidoreductase YuxK
MKKPLFPVRVFYDGACLVCATEIEHYVRHDRHGRLTPVDISPEGFSAELPGVSRQALMYELHVVDSGGTIYRGVDAFWAIWQAFPANSWYGLLGKLITLPVINGCARLMYRGFARIRKYLPKRHPPCSGGSCRTHRQD